MVKFIIYGPLALYCANFKAIAFMTPEEQLLERSRLRPLALFFFREKLTKQREHYFRTCPWTSKLTVGGVSNCS